MLPPSTPSNEARRLFVLRALGILDTLPEERFDRVTRLARRLFDVPIVLLSLVDAERQWFKSREGLEATETPREISFCGHAVASGEVLLVHDAVHDNRFHDNPLVTGDPGIRFYAGRPIRVQGVSLGTLCLIDRRPREFGAEDLAVLDDLAEMIESEFRALHDATTDVLTGLTNRRGFEVAGASMVALCRRLRRAVTLLHFDLDGFKRVNDTLGHAAGDQMLVDFARALTSSFREADLITRFGGDEFCVLACGEATGLAGAIERLRRDLLARPDDAPPLRFSVGHGEGSPTDNLTVAELLAAADRAMYDDKARKREQAETSPVAS